MPKIAYNAIHADLLWKMEAGLIAPGDRLPSENELVKRYDVSRMTMRKVLRMLADEGYLASRAGVGWEVLRTNRQDPAGRKMWRIGVDRLPYYFARCYRDRILQGIQEAAEGRNVTLVYNDYWKPELRRADALDALIMQHPRGLDVVEEFGGWEKPVYIHCPPVMKDAQNKLSKRNGDASYQDLVAKGYLPQAVLNYLLLLGWAPEGEQEIFTLDEMIRIWDPARISKSPAIFDPLKLRAINAAYIRALPPEEFRRLADPFIDSAVHRDIDRDLLCANLQPRCEVLEDIPPQLDFFDAVLPYDAELYRNKKQKTTPESAKEALTALLPVLEGVTDWNRDAIFDACKAQAEAMEKKNGWLL